MGMGALLTTIGIVHQQNKGVIIMKKRLLFVIITLSLVLSIFTSGCGTKKTSYVGKLFADKSEIAEGETQEAIEYKSLIEKYVRKSGEPYTAHDYMINEGMNAKHLAGEWLDADGKFSLPFDPDDIKGMHTYVYEGVTYETLVLNEGAEHYYIPDEIALKATTKELTDVFVSYGYNGGYIPLAYGRHNFYRDYEHAFALLLSYSNALEESLRREDFAASYYEKYMAESEKMPENHQGKDIQLRLLLSYKTETLNVIEVLLAQPESYEQLTAEQRETLVRRVLEREKQGEQGKLFSDDSEYWTHFFACIAGEMYLPPDMAAIPDTTGGLTGITGAIERDNNPWLDTISTMEFTEEEQKILEKYFVRR